MRMNSRRPRRFEAAAPTAHMFRDSGKSLGRGRGPRLDEVPVPKEQPAETRQKIGTQRRTLVNVDGAPRPFHHRY